VAVLPFENQTGEVSLSYLRKAIPNLLITNLEQSKYVRVLTWERLGDLLRSRDNSVSEVVEMERETAFELCRQDGVQEVVVGSYTKAGNVFATDIKVLDAETKELLISATSRGDGLESILKDQIDELSKAVTSIVKLKTGFSETEPLRIADVTTQSLDAYRLYLEGVSFFHGMRVLDARNTMEQAVSLDPSFAMAFYYLSKSLRDLGNHEAAEAALQKAMQHADETTLRESLLIQMDYARFVERDRQKSVQINCDLVSKFPKEKIAFHYLATKLSSDGNVTEAIDASRQTIRLDPNFTYAYNHLAYCHARMGDFDQALSSARKFVALASNEPNAYDSLAELLLLAGRLDEAAFNATRSQEIAPEWDGGRLKLGYVYALREQYDRCLSQYDKYSADEEETGIRLFGLRHHALACFILGRSSEGLRLLKDQRSLAESLGNALLMAEAHILSGFIQAESHDMTATLEALQRGMEIVNSSSVSQRNQQRWGIVECVISGLLAIGRGDVDSAEARSADVDSMLIQRDDEIQEIHAFLSAILKGEIALFAGAESEAIRTFQAVRPPDPFFYMLWPYPNLFMNFFVRDGLARAYHLSGNLDRAIEEYERLVTFAPESTERFLIHPRYHYRLGMLYEQRGWTGRAIQEYEKFLKFWQEADREHSALKDAKERLESLRR
jgi:tetratricopeptide (TPR) repeat protein